jgi:hypothetical protein
MEVPAPAVGQHLAMTAVHRLDQADVSRHPLQDRPAERPGRSRRGKRSNGRAAGKQT